MSDRPPEALAAAIDEFLVPRNGSKGDGRKLMREASVSLRQGCTAIREMAGVCQELEQEHATIKLLVQKLEAQIAAEPREVDPSGDVATEVETLAQQLDEEVILCRVAPGRVLKHANTESLPDLNNWSCAVGSGRRFSFGVDAREAWEIAKLAFEEQSS